MNEYETIRIVGIDSITDYYDVTLKYKRLKELQEFDGRFVSIHESIANREMVDRIFVEYHSQILVNLAAWAGVRYTLPIRIPILKAT